LAQDAVELLSGRAELQRGSRLLEVTARPEPLEAGDVLRTFEEGRLQLQLRSGDTLTLAPDTEVRYEPSAREPQSFTLTLKGQVLARIAPLQGARRVILRTPNAIVSVRGTEFVVQFLRQETAVGTLEGLVELTALGGGSIEVPAGSRSGVNASGTVLPLSEFAGEMLKDFEFAGEQMDPSGAAGERIDLSR
jgi:ferric-dicitrate binding protein FerR (iron transport regulator)